MLCKVFPGMLEQSRDYERTIGGILLFAPFKRVDFFRRMLSDFFKIFYKESETSNKFGNPRDNMIKF